jgi:hypothetical protein
MAFDIDVALCYVVEQGGSAAETGHVVKLMLEAAGQRASRPAGSSR